MTVFDAADEAPSAPLASAAAYCSALRCPAGSISSVMMLLALPSAPIFAKRAIMPVLPSATRFHPGGGANVTPNDGNSPLVPATAAAPPGCVAATDCPGVAGAGAGAADAIVLSRRTARAIVSRIRMTVNVRIIGGNATGAFVAHPNACAALTLTRSARTILRLAATN
jgi:hypothetical protein